MTEADGPTSSLTEELRAILAGLHHARRSLAVGDIASVDALRSRLDSCARRVDALDADARRAVGPLMLALTDELQRTIAAFGAAHRDLGDKLRSADRSLAADTAYRRAGLR